MFPVIVIHGGGWNGGDKSGDGQQIADHLASMGFVLFDIQYRLVDSSLLDTKTEFGIENMWGTPTPTTYTNLYGNYSITDMVRDIGEFTRYLGELPAEERHYADLDSVIILGTSAGGYLEGITAFGYSHPFLAGNFSAALTIKAVALINPPCDAEYFFYEGHPMYYPLLIPGTPDELPAMYHYLTPSNLIDENSPPTILFHGTIDKMVPPENSQMMYTQLQAYKRPSVYVKGPFGGHGFDFGAHFAPINMYYLERFLFHTLLVN